MTASDDEVLKLCDQVRQTAFELHAFLRHGHLERVYENGLVHRLRKLDIRVEQQHPLSVSDEDGTLLGEYCADLFIESCLIVELKACRAIAPEHLGPIARLPAGDANSPRDAHQLWRTEARSEEDGHVTRRRFPLFPSGGKVALFFPFVIFVPFCG
jgi:GxxExxY protein